MAMIDKSEEKDYELIRKRAQKIAFAKIEELLQRNVSKNVTKSFTQYTKELLRTYINSPVNNQDTLREISRFLCRHSMLYQKILMYYASMPLFYYNIVQINDLTKDITPDKALKSYQNMLKDFETLRFKKENYVALFSALRDGFYVGYMYDSDADGKFFMGLDVQYCRIAGKNKEGEFTVYFNAQYFDKGSNKDFIYGVNEDGIGVWDDVFIEGYENYKANGKDFMWFKLPTEKTMCLITCPEDEFYAPLPFFLPLFDLILANLDLNALVDSRNELENYILLVSKIPMLKNTENVDDFAVSLELAQQMQRLIDSAVPDLVGTAYSPMEIEKLTFERSNTTETQDALAESIQNIFNNAGASQLVVAGGSSTNSIGLKHAIANDMSTCWTWVDRLESWYNYYIKVKYGDFRLQIHKVTWYNQEEYVSQQKDSATLGGSAMDYLTAKGDTPYIAYQKLYWENAMGIKDLMRPLSSSYTQTNNDGKPQKSEEDIQSEETIKTRDLDKNDGTKANNRL